MNKIYKILAFIFFLAPFNASAATMYMETGADEYGAGDTFALDIYLDIDEECVNTVAAAIEYPSDYVNVINFIDGESILNLWVDKPNQEKIKLANNNGALSFAGGTPGGYCGRIPGDPGRSNLVARIIFAIPGLIISDTERDIIKLDFNQEETKVLLNDGYGTEDKLVLIGTEYKVGASATQNTKEWERQIIDDKIKPEPFVVELRRDPNMFNNRFYIIFHTVDKQSGLDHYEVLETRNDKETGISEKKSIFERFFTSITSVPEWKIAEIPYVLEDQELNSVIRVKAVDKAGNERFVEYIPPAEFKAEAQTSLEKILFMLLLGIGVIIIILVIIFIYVKKFRNASNKQNL